MASEALRAQQVLETMKTVAASNVPTPGDGPVLFADSSDRPTATIRVKTPDGSTHDVLPQAGVATLVTGVTALISATITASSRIIVTLKTPDTITATAAYAALTADRVVGLASASGGFKISALKTDSTVNTADVSTLDWVVIN